MLSAVVLMAAVLVFLPISLTRRENDVQAVSDPTLRDQIEAINEDVQRRKDESQLLSEKINHYKALILNKKLESASLEDQVSLIESQIAKTKVSIEIAEQEIRSLELQVSRLDGRISSVVEKMERERILLGSLARELYRRQVDRSTLEILLTRGTFAEFFDGMYAIVSLRRQLNDSLGRVNDLKASLEEERELRESKLVAVSERKLSLEEARRKLEDERAFQEALLIETKASELEYRYLLAELKQEQNEADAEIAYLEKVLREKIDLSDRVSEQATVLSWPVDASRGLTALFHDPEYPYRYVFEHPGIDIRAYQGTPVRASAAGIVARAKNAGLGYSYVMLIHNNNISTVYGHLSKIEVKEDTFVERGEVIGYSGGMPGTPGAGKLTTGPHLHFEVRLEGIPVNPLQYLVVR